MRITALARLQRGSDKSGLDFFGSFLIKQKGTKVIARQGVKIKKNLQKLTASIVIIIIFAS